MNSLYKIVASGVLDSPKVTLDFFVGLHDQITSASNEQELMRLADAFKQAKRTIGINEKTSACEYGNRHAFLIQIREIICLEALFSRELAPLWDVLLLNRSVQGRHSFLACKVLHDALLPQPPDQDAWACFPGIQFFISGSHKTHSGINLSETGLVTRVLEKVFGLLGDVSDQTGLPACAQLIASCVAFMQKIQAGKFRDINEDMKGIQAHIQEATKTCKEVSTLLLPKLDQKMTRTQGAHYQETMRSLDFLIALTRFPSHLREAHNAWGSVAHIQDLPLEQVSKTDCLTLWAILARYPEAWPELYQETLAVNPIDFVPLKPVELGLSLHEYLRVVTERAVLLALFGSSVITAPLHPFIDMVSNALAALGTDYHFKEGRTSLGIELIREGFKFLTLYAMVGFSPYFYLEAGIRACHWLLEGARSVRTYVQCDSRGDAEGPDLRKHIAEAQGPVLKVREAILKASSNAAWYDSFATRMDGVTTTSKARKRLLACFGDGKNPIRGWLRVWGITSKELAGNVGQALVCQIIILNLLDLSIYGYGAVFGTESTLLEKIGIKPGSDLGLETSARKIRDYYHQKREAVMKVSLSSSDRAQKVSMLSDEQNSALLELLEGHLISTESIYAFLLKHLHIPDPVARVKSLFGESGIESPAEALFAGFHRLQPKIGEICPQDGTFNTTVPQLNSAFDARYQAHLRGLMALHLLQDVPSECPVDPDGVVLCVLKADARLTTYISSLTGPMKYDMQRAWVQLKEDMVSQLVVNVAPLDLLLQTLEAKMSASASASASDSLCQHLRDTVVKELADVYVLERLGLHTRPSSGTIWPKPLAKKTRKLMARYHPDNKGAPLLPPGMTRADIFDALRRLNI